MRRKEGKERAREEQKREHTKKENEQNGIWQGRRRKGRRRRRGKWRYGGDGGGNPVLWEEGDYLSPRKKNYAYYFCTAEGLLKATSCQHGHGLGCNANATAAQGLVVMAVAMVLAAYQCSKIQVCVAPP